MIHNTLKCIYVVCALLLGPNPRPTFLYFPTVLPRPAEVSQKKTESDEARRLLERDLGEAGGQLRRLLPGGSLGEAPTHKSAQIFDKAAQGGARAGAKFSAAIDKLRRRRLLLGEDLGKLAKGGGGFSWRRCRRCSETLPRPSPGDAVRKLAGENSAKLQAMKFCSFPGFFHILAKSPGVPPTVSNLTQRPCVPIIWSEGESTTYCPRTIGADPLVRQRDFGGRRLLPEEAWGKLAKGVGDYSWRKPGGSPRRAVEASPGDVAGDAPRHCPDLRRETMPEDGPTSSDDHSWKEFGRKKSRIFMQTQ